MRSPRVGLALAPAPNGLALARPGAIALARLRQTLALARPGLALAQSSCPVRACAAGELALAPPPEGFALARPGDIALARLSSQVGACAAGTSACAVLVSGSRLRGRGVGACAAPEKDRACASLVSGSRLRGLGVGACAAPKKDRACASLVSGSRLRGRGVGACAAPKGLALTRPGDIVLAYFRQRLELALRRSSWLHGIFVRCNIGDNDINNFNINSNMRSTITEAVLAATKMRCAMSTISLAMATIVHKSSHVTRMRDTCRSNRIANK